MSLLSVERASVVRPEPEPRRDPTPTRAESPFAELLDAALAPSSAARPLTRPAAADADDAARGAPPNGTMRGDDGPTGSESTPGGANEPATQDSSAAAATDALVRNAQASARETAARSPGAGAASTAESATDATDEESADAVTAAGAPSTGATAGSEPATSATAAATVAGVHGGTAALVPEMRARLARVQQRMRDEYGYDVQVVETYRGQARQDALYAQGRTAPGPVVTWTRSSNHTRGRAADVMIDGGYGNARAFATLQQVAREEGLQTLGARDPGHLELKGGTAGRPIDVAALAELAKGSDATVRVSELHMADDTPAAVARVAAVAQPATVARVAAVAQPAAVAQVATVAVPGARYDAMSGGGARRATAGIGAAATGGATAASTAAREGAGQLAAPVARRGAHAEREASADAGGSGTGADTTSAFGHELAGGAADGTTRHGSAAAPVRAGAPVSGSDALARLDQIDLLREGAAARPLSHITLSLDGAGGTTDRVRVALNGTTVGATLELGDAMTAHRVGAHLGELQQALEQRGLRTDALQVRQHADVAPDAIAMGRVAGLALEREAARGGGNPSSGQHPAPQRERDGRPSPDGSQQDSSSPRHRARRDSKEGR